MNMKYYHLMIIIGGIILYMLLNIYPIIVYLIKTIRERDVKEIIRIPFEIILLLIPIIGSIYGLIIVDFENKWYSNYFFNIPFPYSFYKIDYNRVYV